MILIEKVLFFHPDKISKEKPIRIYIFIKFEKAKIAVVNRRPHEFSNRFIPI